MPSQRLRVAWISEYPVEWMSDAPESIRHLPKQHPATWMRVLLGELLQTSDLELHIFTLRNNIQQDLRFERAGVTFHVLKTPRGLRAPTLFWTDTLRLRHALKRVQPDLIHAWGTERGAALVASRLGYPYLLTMQGLLEWLAELTPLGLYHRFIVMLERPSLRRASVVTVESMFGLNYLRERYPHLDLHHVEHAPLPRFHQVKRNPQTYPFRFLFVGSFNVAKGADMILHALNQVKSEFPFELVIAGHVDQPWLNQAMKNEAADLKQRIRFAGLLDAEGVAEELTAATIFLYPSRCDNSPNAVKEAVVAGVPVIASAVGGIVDYVWPGRNGDLFPPGDSALFVETIRRACRHPRFSQGQVDVAALNTARSQLSASQMARQFSQIYRAIACHWPEQSDEAKRQCAN